MATEENRTSALERDLARMGREQVLTWQAEAQVERNTQTQMEYYQALGVGLAAFCVAMATALEGDMFTREERLRLIEAAVRGR